MKIPASQIRLRHRFGHRVGSSGPPRAIARIVLTTKVTGWWLAKACSQPGMDAIGTNAEDTNVSGNSQINPNDCTASSSPMASPVKAEMHAIATPNTVASTTMATAGPTPFRNRNPTA
jgi:hypothetical protein